MPLLPINEKDVLNCALHWREMQNASYDSSLFKISCGCHCNDLLLNLPMKRSEAVTISSSAPCFSWEMGKVMTSSHALLDMLCPQLTFIVTLLSFQLVLFVTGGFTLLIFIPESELTREWMTKHELCQMIKPFRRQVAPGEQISKSVLLWELNSIDGGVFRCHLWAQFFWHGTSVSSSFARQQRAETLPSERRVWGLQSSVNFVANVIYIITFLQMMKKQCICICE